LAWNAHEELAAPTAASLKFAKDLVETKLARPDWIWRL
jgi:hypothetical protein